MFDILNVSYGKVEFMSAIIKVLLHQKTTSQVLL